MVERNVPLFLSKKGIKDVSELKNETISFEYSETLMLKMLSGAVNLYMILIQIHNVNT